MRISHFIQNDVDRYQRQCNFSDREQALFYMRVKGHPLEECADRMGVSVSTVKRIYAEIKNKIKIVDAMQNS